MSIEFYNVDHPEQLYTLEGNTVSFEAFGQTVSLEYPPKLIQKFFKDGTWVPVVDEEVVKKPDPAPTNQQGGAIASDGRSSTYYDIGLPNWLIARVLERYEDGRAYIKTEELIEVAFNDDFDAGNAFKSLVRLWGAFNGAGKAGNSVSYEKNKIEYSVDKLEKRYKRQEVAA